MITAKLLNDELNLFGVKMNTVVTYALLWLSFGLGHTLLTMPRIKQHLEPYLGSLYRIAYNLFALIHIALVLIIGQQILDTARFTAFSSTPVVILSSLIVLAGVVLTLLALRQYDLGLFSGVSQWRAGKRQKVLENEPLQISGLNRWVRHPLYTGLFLFLWGGAMSPFGFWTAIFASIYLVIGAHYEERKLTTLYGKAYTEYQKNVPAFFSLKMSGR